MSKLILNPNWEASENIKTWYNVHGLFQNDQHTPNLNMSLQDLSIFEGN